jgi:uncharacterized membrane protein YkvA (DUF1232 family)
MDRGADRRESQYRLVSGWIDQVSKIIIGLIVLTYAWRLLAGGSLGTRVRDWARALRRDVYAIWLAARDPRVPWYAKGAALLVAAYAASPIDLIPDFIPILGQLDDVILVPLGVLLAARLIPDELLDEHRRAAAAMAEKPTDWRVGALVIAIWAVALAFLLRWLVEILASS